MPARLPRLKDHHSGCPLHLVQNHVLAANHLGDVGRHCYAISSDRNVYVAGIAAQHPVADVAANQIGDDTPLVEPES